MSAPIRHGSFTAGSNGAGAGYPSAYPSGRRSRSNSFDRGQYSAGAGGAYAAYPTSSSRTGSFSAAPGYASNVVGYGPAGGHVAPDVRPYPSGSGLRPTSSSSSASPIRHNSARPMVRPGRPTTTTTQGGRASSHSADRYPPLGNSAGAPVGLGPVPSAFNAAQSPYAPAYASTPISDPHAAQFAHVSGYGSFGGGAGVPGGGRRVGSFGMSAAQPLGAPAGSPVGYGTGYGAAQHTAQHFGPLANGTARPPPPPQPTPPQPFRPVGAHPSDPNPVHPSRPPVPQSAETYFDSSFPHYVALHGYLTIIFEAGRNLNSKDSNGLSDPYCQLQIDKSRIVKTLTCQATLNPSFREKHVVPVCHAARHMEVLVKDEDEIGADDMGAIAISLRDVLEGRYAHIAWHQVYEKKKPAGEIAFSITYQPTRDPHHPRSGRVPYTVFPLHHGCYVKLYQDAHVSPFDVNAKYQVQTSTGRYENACAWEDVFRSFMRAERFIYVIGWSVWTELVMLRERNVDGVESGVVRLGNLLVDKARAGVAVYVLQWDEVTSNSTIALVGRLLGEGLMGTHDEESEAFFKNTPVHFIKVSRSGKNSNRSIIYTHHQKAIICDAPHPVHAPMRMVTAYVGGLDLCDGRFDTPTHPLFVTLQSWHKEDFHMPTAKGVTAENGPRQPWHDIHMYVEGAVALDVKKNFDDRWMRAAVGHRVPHPYLLPSDFVSPEHHSVSAPSPQAWACQLVRSIDGESAVGLPPGCLREATIQQAYVHMIRKAERFIYIENQYFIGSSHLWGNLTSSQPNARNLVPAELALRVCQKIRAREPFCVYVVLPLHPEGVPGAAATQAILRWQYYTIAMMYRMIGSTIQQCGWGSHPTNWLQFFFLGAREAPTGVATPPPSSKAGKLMHAARRHMIYVHSKLMIVDDESVLVGSVVSQDAPHVAP